MKKYLFFLRLIPFTILFVYQKTLSPDHGLLKVFYPNGYCKFYPSCSEYSKQAFLKYGVLKGFYLTLQRLAKCNPWSEPGIQKLQ